MKMPQRGRRLLGLAGAGGDIRRSCAGSMPPPRLEITCNSILMSARVTRREGNEGGESCASVAGGGGVNASTRRKKREKQTRTDSASAGVGPRV